MKKILRPLLGVLPVFPLLMLCTACNHVASSHDDSGAPYPSPLPLQLPAIQLITVTTPVADYRSDFEKQSFPPNFRCADFPVKPADMERFFSLTQQISKQDYLHAVDWIGCKAFGDIAFTDGSKAKWSLMLLSGAGELSFEDGRQVFLFCAQCKEPFLAENHE